ncbi:MAG: YkgJ family cysteine cluster protein, partial [Saprospiraceae bacterium]
MRIDPDQVNVRFLKNQSAYKKFLARAEIKKLIPKLALVAKAAYAKTDCLQCAACCKNYSPRFKAPDLKRISKFLGMKESELISKHLHRDEDGDFVLNSTPCVFLGADNYCTIYDVRPSDCHRFPYVDEDVLLKRKELTLKNASFCPIVQ